jgi:hypothetical protein
MSNQVISNAAELGELAAIVGGELLAPADDRDCYKIKLDYDFVHTIKSSGKQIRMQGYAWFYFRELWGVELGYGIIGPRGRQAYCRVENYLRTQIDAVDAYRHGGLDAAKGVAQAAISKGKTPGRSFIR